MESSSSPSPPLTTVKVLGEYQISPPPGSVPHVCIPLTYLDVNWAFVNIMVERIFYYHFTEPASFLINHVVPKLKSSLSLALQHFYPLAGNLRLSPGTTDKYEIHCKDGDSVSFAVAESDADFKYLSERHVHELNRVYPLLPQLPREDSKPMLAIRVTSFSNSGISIAVAIHHAASDDSGIMHFIKSWASACSSGGSAPFLQPPPLIDRSVIPDPHGFYYHRVKLGQRNPVNRAPNLICGATFPLGTDNILKLQKLATAKTETPFHCSTFVVACAYTWVCAAKALRYPRDERALFIFPMDIRGAVLPPHVATNASYFGNCVRPCHVEAEVARLVEDDGGVQLAAEAIGGAIQRCRSDGVEDAKLWQERNAFGRMAGRILAVSGSPKLGVHDTDFGWGRPCKVEVAPRGGTGAIGMIALAESRDEAGGIEIGLFLPRNQMEEFSLCFHGGLLSLNN